MTRDKFISDVKEQIRQYGEDAAEGIADLVGKVGRLSRRMVNPAKIIEAVCEEFDISGAKIISRNRADKIRTPRQVAMYLIRKKAKMSYNQIGALFMLDHSTVIHACRRIADLIETEEETKERINRISSSL